MKTVLYDKRSKSRGAEVSGPVLMLVGLTVELERDYEETRRRSRMPRWATRPSVTCVQVVKTASGECYAVTSTGHEQCAVVCWYIDMCSVRWCVGLVGASVRSKC